MSTRRLITKFIKERGYTLESAFYDRNTEHAYGDSWDNSEWCVKIKEIPDEIYGWKENIIEEIKKEIECFESEAGGRA